MTEQNYIDVKELSTITAAINILCDLVPENSSVITDEEYKKVMPTLCQWQERLFKKINIKH